MEKGEVTGYIENVKSENNSHTFTVNDVSYTYNGFLPILNGDMIYGEYMIYGDGEGNEILKSPFIYIPDDKKNIFEYMKMSIQNFTLFDRLYYDLKTNILKAGFCSKNAKTEDDVTDKNIVDYLNMHAVKKDVLSFSMGTCLNEIKSKYFLTAWYKKRILRKLYLLGMSNNEIFELKMNVNLIYEKITENPFIIHTIDINKAQHINNILKKDTDKDDLECGKITRDIYRRMTNQKCTCVHTDKIQDIYMYKDKLEQMYNIVFDNDYVYFKYSHEVEFELSRYFITLIEKNEKLNKPEIIDCNNYVCKTLTDEQKNAIMSSIGNYVSIIDSSAGTGKSTIIKEILINLKKRNVSFKVCAFTGKAVSRINEIYGENVAFTMDSMILAGSKTPFRYLIIDEVSMLTTELFYRLIQIYTHNIRIIFVGDSMQLQPVSWDCLLNHLLKCEKIPVYKLTKNHRSANLILKNANKLIDKERIKEIEEGRYVQPVGFENGVGFHFYDKNIDFINTLVLQMYNSNISLNRFIILSPYNEKLISLNKIVRDIYLKNVKKHINNGVTWSVGDKVMLVKNFNLLNIYNGNEGVITNVIYPDEIPDNKYGGIKVKFPKIEVDISFQNSDYDDYSNISINDIQHSFAITVDKSQGSEYDFVIIYIDRAISTFININRLYVAITRAKKECFLVGTKYEIENATCLTEKSRQGFLCSRILNNCEIGVSDAYDNDFDDFSCFD